MANRGDHVVEWAPPGVLAGERSEGLAWANFQEDSLRVVEQLGQAVAETNRPAQMTHPVFGVGRLVGGNPVARQVRQEA